MYYWERFGQTERRVVKKKQQKKTDFGLNSRSEFLTVTFLSIANNHGAVPDVWEWKEANFFKKKNNNNTEQTHTHGVSFWLFSHLMQSHTVAASRLQEIKQDTHQQPHPLHFQQSPTSSRAASKFSQSLQSYLNSARSPIWFREKKKRICDVNPLKISVVFPFGSECMDGESGGSLITISSLINFTSSLESRVDIYEQSDYEYWHGSLQLIWRVRRRRFNLTSLLITLQQTAAFKLICADTVMLSWGSLVMRFANLLKVAAES